MFHGVAPQRNLSCPSYKRYMVILRVRECVVTIGAAADDRQSASLSVLKDFLYTGAMPRRLKYLNALHAFEAAARLGTFTRAAQELGVTPAAVGQQVRVLEGYLGCKLFKRTNQGLQATANASLALVDLHSGFDRLEAGFGRLVGQATENRLSVSVAPALAWRWLTPRIHRLYQRCPNIDLRMDASLRLVDVVGGEFDIAVRYGEEERGGLASPVLFEEHQLPVCAPGLWQDGGSSTREDRLLNLPLLHVESETSDASVSTWRDWATPRLYAPYRVKQRFCRLLYGNTRNYLLMFPLLTPKYSVLLICLPKTK